MKKALQALLPKDFNGILYLTHEGNTYEIIQGYRDLANEIPLTHNTKFGVASMSKTFVSVAILMLIEQEKLTFETTLSDVFSTDIGKLEMQTTVKELLTHHSLIPDYFDEDKFDDYSLLWQDIPNYRIRKNSDLLPLFIDKPKKSEQGFSYNNSGYVMLAEIIERITGQAFDMFIKEQIFDIAHMDDTGYYALDELPANTANHYIMNENGTYHTNIYSIDVKGTGAGGCFTTIPDIKSFWNTLYSYKLISEKYVTLMADNSFSGVEIYGLGHWLLANKDKTEYIPYLQGADPGSTALSVFDYKTDFMLTIFSNNETDIWTLRRNIFELIFGG